MSDRWINILFVSLLLFQLVILSRQPQIRGSFGERLLLATVAPIGHAVGSAYDSVVGSFGYFASSRALHRENQQLRAELEESRRELRRLDRRRESAGRSTASMPRGGDSFVADVVMIDTVWLRSLVLFTEGEQLRRNQAVVNSLGLVGRVLLASGSYGKIQLVTDPSLSVGAMLRRTRRTGLIRGIGEGRLELLYLPLQADVAEGDEVVTAGIDGVFPRDVLIGTVTSVEAGQGLFHRVEVAPAVDFGLLETVDVLSFETVPPDVKEALAIESP